MVDAAGLMQYLLVACVSIFFTSYAIEMHRIEHLLRVRIPSTPRPKPD